jgi:15-cis-phytoene synthase
VHALYAFARHADEIVDDLDGTVTAEDRARRLADLGDRFRAGAAGDEVLPAVLHTRQRWAIPQEHFEAFLASMRMDLTVTEYATYDDLMAYVYGSAAVIGLQMVPILEPLRGLEAVAEEYARDLGVGFQLTNFIRDVGEDLRRGRVYLPMEDLDHFGVKRQQLREGVVDGRVRRLLAYEIGRTRELFRAAAPGVRLLHPTSRDCVRTALTLYAGILDAVERSDYQVLDRRARVGAGRRLAVAVPGLIRAAATRREAERAPTTPTPTGSSARA